MNSTDPNVINNELLLNSINNESTQELLKILTKDGLENQKISTLKINYKSISI